METKDFKNVFSEIAKENGFQKASGCWFKTSKECIVKLDLQKSNFSNSYYLNISAYVQDLFGKTYSINKEIANEFTAIFRRSPKDYDKFLDCESEMNEEDRKVGLIKLFRDFLVKFVDELLTKSGIKNLSDQKEIFLTEIVKEKLA